MAPSTAWSKTYRRVSFGPNEQAKAYATEKAQELELRRSVKIVYEVIASLTDDNWGNCYRSIDNLTKMCGHSRAAVEKALTALRNKGLIAVERSVQVNGMRPVRVYRLVKTSLGADGGKG